MQCPYETITFLDRGPNSLDSVKMMFVLYGHDDNIFLWDTLYNEANSFVEAFIWKWSLLLHDTSIISVKIIAFHLWKRLGRENIEYTSTQDVHENNLTRENVALSMHEKIKYGSKIGKFLWMEGNNFVGSHVILYSGKVAMAMKTKKMITEWLQF